MNKKTVIIILSVMILGLSIGYAALSSSLNITGSAKLGATATNWNIHFENAGCQKNGYADPGTLTTKKTSLEINDIKLKAPGDYVLCAFDIVNDGTIDAEISSIIYPDKDDIVYTGSGSTKTADETLIKNGIYSAMMYQDFTPLSVGDVLKAKETKKAVIGIQLQEDVTKLPTNEVTLSNIFAQIIFGQVTENSNKDDTSTGKGIEKTYSVGELVYYNPVNNIINCKTYKAKYSYSENKTGCMKWYVIADNNSTINLLLDHNTTYSVAWNSSGKNTEGPVTANAKLASDVSEWSSQAKSTARMITADEVWNITSSTNGQSNWSSSTSSNSFYFEGSEYSGKGTSKYAWLYDYTNWCQNYGCKTFDNNIYGYWTSSPRAGSSGSAWRVGQYGDLDWFLVGATNYGLRPVITISKSDVLTS